MNRHAIVTLMRSGGLLIEWAVAQALMNKAIRELTDGLASFEVQLSTELTLWRKEADRIEKAKVDKAEMTKLLSRKMDTCT